MFINTNLKKKGGGENRICAASYKEGDIIKDHKQRNHRFQCAGLGFGSATSIVISGKLLNLSKPVSSSVKFMLKTTL